MASTSFVLASILALAALLGCCHGHGTDALSPAKAPLNGNEAELQRSGLIAIEKVKVGIKNLIKLASSFRDSNNTHAVDVAINAYNSSIDMYNELARLVKMDNVEDRRNAGIDMLLYTAGFELDTAADDVRSLVEGGSLPEKWEIASTRVAYLVQDVEIIVTKLC